MALLRWIHLRQLVPLSDLIQGLEKGGPRAAALRRGRIRSADRPQRRARLRRPPPPCAPRRARPRPRPPPSRPSKRPRLHPTGGNGAHEVSAVAPGEVKDAFLAEVRRHKKFFYGTVIAQAQRIDVEPGRIVFTFGRSTARCARRWTRRRPGVARDPGDAARRPAHGDRRCRGDRPLGSGDTTWRQWRRHPGAGRARSPGRAATAGPRRRGVQAMLDVFATDIKDVREL
jgi:hypothetical protein